MHIAGGNPTAASWNMNSPLENASGNTNLAENQPCNIAEPNAGTSPNILITPNHPNPLHQRRQLSSCDQFYTMGYQSGVSIGESHRFTPDDSIAFITTLGMSLAWFVVSGIWIWYLRSKRKSQKLAERNGEVVQIGKVPKSNEAAQCVSHRGHR